MPLTPGTTLGPYEIQAPLGAGGMGEVYKARDTRLDRTVAIKVLPEHVAADPDLKQRFEREAKTVAALSHPHICPVFDVGSQDGIDFLVMEHLDGETLAQRLDTGALPLEQALQIAIQIADALDKAHRQGIVHRDLKPGNIMLTKAGAKLLDFGLAKLKPVGGDAGLTGLPTQSAGLTGEGAILGTLQYMAPEQLESKEADARTDIFAFGAVVYEMVTGRKAFEGKSQASLISAIMADEPPPLASVQPMSPPALGRIVDTCLAKQPDDRWNSAGDVGRQLQWVTEGSSAREQGRGTNARRPAQPLWMATTVILALTVAGLAFALFESGPARESTGEGPGAVLPTSRTLVELPPPALLAVGTQLPLVGFESPSLALSPDGSQLVYVGSSSAGTSLYLREMNSFSDPRQLPGTEGALFAAFSPDGREIAFLTSDRLKKISIDGRSPTTLCRARSPTRASWVAAGVIYLMEDQGRTLSQVSATGGDPTEIVSERSDGRMTHVLPNGRAALMTSVSPGSISNDYASVQALMLDTLTTKPLLSAAYDARYLPTGHLLFARGGALLAVPFDADRVEVTGEEVVVLQGVAMESLFGTVHAASSENGVLAYVAGGDLARGKLAWVDRHGEDAVLDTPERVYGSFDVHPDEQQIAAIVGDVDDYIWVWDDGEQTGQVVGSGASRLKWSLSTS